MPAVPHSRDANGILLPAEVSSQIWQDAQEASVVMQKATRIDLPGVGIDVPLITGDPIAEWVGETEKIKVGEATFGNKSIRPRKVALIELFSNEFKRDLPALYAALAERLPKTLATAFDQKAMHAAAEASAFDSLAGATAMPLRSATAYEDGVAIDSAVYEAGGVTDNYVLSPKARRVLLDARGALGESLLGNSITGNPATPSILGSDLTYARTAYKAGTPNVLGYAGQWTGNAFYGVVQGITVAVSTESSIDRSAARDGSDIVNLFQQDMFALRVIAHMGFAVRDLDKFVKVTDDEEE
jgi:HK97 family phage major capsid protein